MSKVKTAVQWMIDIANDDSHGYDQTNRQGPDYDCSSLVINGYEKAGVPVKESGASYTGNIYSSFIKAGFKDVTNEVNLKTCYNMKEGDICLYPGKHVVCYIGNKKIVHASINEKGKVTGGNTGDQTGKEICVRSYYNKPWKYVLRYEEKEEKNKVKSEVSYKMPVIKKGSKGKAVKIWQIIIGVESDGSFGPNTDKVTREWQKNHGLEVDGSVGPLTWKAGLESV